MPCGGGYHQQLYSQRGLTLGPKTQAVTWQGMRIKIIKRGLETC